MSRDAGKVEGKTRGSIECRESGASWRGLASRKLAVLSEDARNAVLQEPRETAGRK